MMLQQLPTSYRTCDCDQFMFTLQFVGKGMNNFLNIVQVPDISRKKFEKVEKEQSTCEHLGKPCITVSLTVMIAAKSCYT